MTFDQLLLGGTTAPANWKYTTPGIEAFVGMGLGTVAGLTVTVPMVAGGPPVADPGTHNYIAAPADVKNAGGVPAAAYANFPTGLA